VASADDAGAIARLSFSAPRVDRPGARLLSIGCNARMTIPLRPVGVSRQPHSPRHRAEAPYSLFILASLSLAAFGGFMLAVLIPLLLALDREVDGARLNALVRAHGQIQLLGFAGLFVMGMASRLMPRFSGRRLALDRIVPAIPVLVASGLLLRAVGDTFASGVVRDVSAIAGAALVAGGSLIFATLVCGTLVGRGSRAEATGWFFVLGAAALAAQAVLAVAVAIEDATSGWSVRAAGYHQALIFVQEYGVVIMFISGVATRAVPTFTGHARANAAGRAAAILLFVGVAGHAAPQLFAAHGERSHELARIQDAALIIIAAALCWVMWLTGIFRPSTDRVATASQTQFWFVRAALAWMLIGALLLVWYGSRAFADGAYVAAFESDAIRHTFTVGVITMMIVGMAMLIVPEFAARRMQHPGERILVLAILFALNVAVALRIWPPIRGVDWIGPDRWWPIAISGVLALTAVVAFAAMFGQSWLELRRSRGTPVAAGGRGEEVSLSP
jgi:hypothetical protein